jgi:hypothetical protein
MREKSPDGFLIEIGKWASPNAAGTDVTVIETNEMLFRCHLFVAWIALQLCIRTRLTLEMRESNLIYKKVD